MSPTPLRILLVTTTAVTIAATVAAPPVGAATPNRVVALTPYTANTLVLLGKRPVGVGQILGGQDRFRPELRGVSILPLSHPNGPNLEQLASLRPDTVLSAPIWRKGSTGMKRLRLRVYESDPRSVNNVMVQTRRIGRLIGRTAAGKRLANAQAAQIRVARKGIRRHPRVLIVLGVGRTSQAMLKNSWGGDVVRKAGGRLITGNLERSGGYVRISDETVARRNPDVIIAVPHGNPGSLSRIAKYLRSKPGWRSTNAAKNRRVYIASGNSLLQSFEDPGRTILDVRRSFLKN